LVNSPNRVGIRNSTDYSPFGVELDGRTVSLDGYRFGFQNQEKDDEIKGDGSSYDFGARLFDPRLGRWLTIDPMASEYTSHSPYVYVRNNPILRIDPNGKWDVEVHVYYDRAKYGYGIAIVKDNDGKEVYRFQVRVEGTGGIDRLVKNSDTPTGVYDIPDQGMWISGGDRKAYGPNSRLVLNGESGEIKESGRGDIRVHGGRQEEYNSETKQWEEIESPILKKTHGCLRSFDEDIAEMKEITDKLEQDDPTEKGGKLTIIPDLKEQNGKYIIPTPNLQTVGNIKFDSNKIRISPKGTLIATDINTGKDYGVVRDSKTGKYNFKM
jgi:RHS repeat-associated protein